MPPTVILSRLERAAAIAILVSVAAGSAISSPRPPAIELIDGQVWDDPQSALLSAQSTLRSVSSAPDAARSLAAALKLAVTAEELEQAEVAKQAVERGIPLAHQLQDNGALCVLHGTDAFVTQTPGGSEARYVDAIAFATKFGMDWCVARLRLGQGQKYSANGRNAEALAAFVEAHRLFELLDDRPRMAATLSDLSWIYHREEDNPQSLRRAIDTGEAALALLDPPHQRHLAGTVHFNLAGAYFASGRMSQASEHIARSRELAEAIGDTVGIGFLDEMQGEVEMRSGQPGLALPMFDQAKTVFEHFGILDMLLRAGVARSEALTGLQRHAAAQKELEGIDALRRKLDNADLDVAYYQASLRLLEGSREFEKALAMSKRLAAAHQRLVSEDHRKAANELQERFETPRKEAEILLLREQRQAATSQRWLLAMTLALSVVLLGGMVAHLHQQRRVRQRLASLAARDDLTGLPNRRSILEAARQVHRAHGRSNEAACVAMLDIDHFKAVNDTYGHEVGDAALIAFSKVCGENLRGRDVLGRFGGEEFLLVLPGAQIAAVEAVFERLRAGLRATAVSGMPSDARLSFSMGAVSIVAGEMIEQAIHRSDEALYRAKTNGRDRLVVDAASHI
ncbi:MAG: GGDEF domain-containing protein [Betaproteobacteria bacterium]